MEKTKRNSLKNVLTALFVAFITFLGLFTALPSTVSADEVPSAPKYGDVIDIMGIIYMDEAHETPIIKLPEMGPEYQTPNLWEPYDTVKTGDTLGGWYRIKMPNWGDGNLSVINIKDVNFNDATTATLRIFENSTTVKLGNFKIETRYQYIGGVGYIEFYLPEDLCFPYAYSYEFDGVNYTANIEGCVTYYIDTTVSYVYDNGEAFELIKVEPTINLDYNPETPVEPEDPTEPETPVEPEDPTEPEDPDDIIKPVPDVTEETVGDKINAWLEQMGENWEELSAAGKGLSIGALIMLGGFIVLLVKIFK